VARAGRPSFDIAEFGAVGDGKTLCTQPIQRAIRACVQAGGGRVVVPAGTFLSGALFLGDNVELHLVAGSRLRASTRFEDFPPITGRSEGIERRCHSSLVNGTGLEHVAITGRGALDGNGELWWNANSVTHELRLAQHLPREAENPPGAPLRWPRPRVVNLTRCQGAVVSGVTIENSPSWSLHLVYCDGVVVDGVTTTGMQALNIDGIVVDSCSNVRISNCLLAQGGEAISLKAGYNEDGRRVNIPCENVIVTNCHATYSVSAAVALGSETAGWIRNVAINNCTVSRSKYGIHIKAPRGRGGGVENVRISNILLSTIEDTGVMVSHFWNSVSYQVLDEQRKPSGDPETDRTMVVPVGEGTPTFRNISISGVTMGAVARVALLEGLPERPIDGIQLRDLLATASQSGVLASRVDGLVLDGLTVNALESPLFYGSHLRRLTLRALTGPRPRGAPAVQLEHTEGAFIHACNVPGARADFLRLDGTANRDVNLVGNNLLGGQ
jgi:polygalacturonase